MATARVEISGQRGHSTARRRVRREGSLEATGRFSVRRDGGNSEAGGGFAPFIPADTEAGSRISKMAGKK